MAVEGYHTSACIMHHEVKQGWKYFTILVGYGLFEVSGNVRQYLSDLFTLLVFSH